MKAIVNRSGLLVAIVVATLLTGCAAPANRSAMAPQNVVVSKHFPYGVKVQTSGGSETSAVGSSNISDADLKAAIEDAISQSQLFKTIVQGAGGDYELSVSVTSLSKPMFGATFTVELETAWSLVKAADRKVLMQKVIQSTGVASFGDALVGVARLRMAVERAASDNISQGLKAVADLNL